MRAICVSGCLVAVLTAATTLTPRAQAQAQPLPKRLELTFNSGKVTLVAQGVTVREIMAEWARQCGCLVQGTDRLPGGSTLPVQFDDQPEAAVLESLLRSAGGYLLGPRTLGSPLSQRASIYGSVSVFPVARGIAAPSYASSMPIAAPLVTGGTPDDEIPPVSPVSNPQTPAQTPPSPPPGRAGGPAVPIVPVGSGSAGSL